MLIKMLKGRLSVSRDLERGFVPGTFIPRMFHSRDIGPTGIDPTGIDTTGH